MQRHISKCQCFQPNFALAAAKGAHACQQFLRGKGFGHVVIGAAVQPGYFVVQLVPRGQHQHRYRVVPGPQAAHDLEPVHTGQHHIQYDHIITAVLGIIQPICSGIYHIGQVVLFPHDLPQRIGQAGFVLYNQDIHRQISFGFLLFIGTVYHN